MDIAFFDEDNNIIVELKATQNVRVYMVDSRCFIEVKNAFFNIDLLKFMGKHKSKDDLSAYLNNTVGKDIITCGGGKKDINCKVVTKTILYNPDTNMISHDLIMEFPKAKIINQIDIDANVGKASPFNLVVEAFQINEDGDFFHIHI